MEIKDVLTELEERISQLDTKDAGLPPAEYFERAAVRCAIHAELRAQSLWIAVGLAGCLAHPNPNPDLAQLCERHAGECDAGAPTIDELRADWYADADGGIEHE